MNKMTFHECYGNLPVKTLRLIRKFNVSPADFDYMTDILGMANDWSVIDSHIVSNSKTGMYVPRFF
jgi:hypothetical protein